jgi:hypothetical protein
VYQCNFPNNKDHTDKGVCSRAVLNDIEPFENDDDTHLYRLHMSSREGLPYAVSRDGEIVFGTNLVGDTEKREIGYGAYYKPCSCDAIRVTPFMFGL